MSRCSTWVRKITAKPATFSLLFTRLRTTRVTSTDRRCSVALPFTTLSTFASMASPKMIAKIPVLQSSSSTRELRAALQSKFDLYVLTEQPDPDAFLADKGHLFRAVVAAGYAPVGGGLVRKLPNLELVTAHSAGVDHLDVAALKARGVSLTNTPDVLSDTVAEASVALLLATMRNIRVCDRYIREGRWSNDGRRPKVGIMMTQLSKKRVGILGLGRIGRAIAKRIESFDCTIGYWGRSAKPGFPSYKFHEDLVDLARHSDVLIAACALTDGTRRVLNRDVLDALGPKGFVVNIARGEVIDEAELVRALVEGRIAGAGLDVFANEPHVPRELLDLDSVVMQPHVACSTVEAHDALAGLVVANLEAHFAGRPLLTPVF